MNSIILDSFRQSYKAIWKKKPILFLLVIVQILFVALFFLSSVYYQPKILEKSKYIYDYLNGQQMTDIDLAKSVLEQKDILGSDFASMTQNFYDLQYYFKVYLTSLFIISLLYFSIAFSLSYKLLGDRFVSIFPKTLIIAFSYLVLIFVFFYSIFNVSMADLASESSRLLSKYVPFLILSVILAYLMFISLGILKKLKLENIIQKTFYIGVRKIHYVLFVYLFNILLYILFMSLAIYFTEKSVLLTFIFMLLLMNSLAFGKIFLINLFEKLKN